MLPFWQDIQTCSALSIDVGQLFYIPVDTARYEDEIRQILLGPDDDEDRDT